MISERVKRGEKFLDEYFPGWEKKINIAELELNNCAKCVLGQLFKSFNVAISTHSSKLEEFVKDDEDFKDFHQEYMKIYPPLSQMLAITMWLGFEVHTDSYEDLTEEWMECLMQKI